METSYLVSLTIYYMSLNVVNIIVLDKFFNFYAKLFFRLALVNPNKRNLFAWMQCPPNTNVVGLALPKINWNFGIILYIVFWKFRLAYLDEYCRIILCRYCNSDYSLVIIVFVRHVPNFERFCSFAIINTANCRTVISHCEYLRFKFNLEVSNIIY